MSRVVTQSRTYDAVFDPVYTTPFTNVSADPRVAQQISVPEAVSGMERYKYSRRPIMPRINAIPPQIMLAPTATQNPMVAIEEEPEPDVKEMGVQTMYRESEAQTVPYTPDYFVPEGEEPEVLILKGLTHENGLPVGQKELVMIENAYRKQELESNLPPFTDEASLHFRKHLMELQELREYKLRESDMDAARNERLEALEQTLAERDEANEFLITQRLEAARQVKMAEKEKKIQKIRSQRIKILRRLATTRNKVDVNNMSKDIINRYFDRTSDIYAPKKREGFDLKDDLQKYDVLSRTAPLNNMNNIGTLELSVPNNLTNVTLEKTSTVSTAAVLSKSLGGTDAAKERMTSAAIRQMRNTKLYVEKMHEILVQKKLQRKLEKRAAGRSVSDTSTTISKPAQAMTTQQFALASKKPTGRPATPDLIDDTRKAVDYGLVNACVLLQKLLRGRAIQNTMHEGRIRRKELISELREADAIAAANYEPFDPDDNERKYKEQQQHLIRETTIESVVGSVATSVVNTLSQEYDRREYLQILSNRAANIVETRRKLEAAEAGRRQREGVTMPFYEGVRECLESPIVLEIVTANAKAQIPQPE